MKTRITVTVVSGFIFIVCGCGPAKKQADTINNINLPQGQTNLENVQTALSEIKEKHQELATSLLQGAKDVQEDAQENVVLPVETIQTNEDAIEFETDLRELETKTKEQLIGQVQFFWQLVLLHHWEEANLCYGSCIISAEDGFSR